MHGANSCELRAGMRKTDAKGPIAPQKSMFLTPFRSNLLAGLGGAESDVRHTLGPPFLRTSDSKGHWKPMIRTGAILRAGTSIGGCLAVSRNRERAALQLSVTSVSIKKALTVER